MSMIYECPSCHAPQAAGQTVCRHCGAEFDSPVPDDAFLPEGTAPEAPQPVLAAASEVDPAETPPQEAEPVLPEPDTPEPPPLEVVTPPPAPAESLPYQSSPYPAPASQSAPTDADQTEAAGRPPLSPRLPSAQALTRALLIAFPIVLVLVLGSVFFARSLNAGQDSAPVPRPAPTPVPAPIATPTAPAAPAAPPYVLNGAVASSGAAGDPNTKRMVGRWESKKLDFYVFNENGTGTRGSLTGKGPQGTFLWTLVQNHLILYADKQEKLAYSLGPDEDTMFLRGEDGKYVQYSRTKT